MLRVSIMMVAQRLFRAQFRARAHGSRGDALVPQQTCIGACPRALYTVAAHLLTVALTTVCSPPAQFCMAHTLRAFRKDMTDAQFYNEGIEKVSKDCFIEATEWSTWLLEVRSRCLRAAVCGRLALARW